MGTQEILRPTFYGPTALLGFGPKNHILLYAGSPLPCSSIQQLTQYQVARERTVFSGHLSCSSNIVPCHLSGIPLPKGNFPS
jgi:hypothetical protein